MRDRITLLLALSLVVCPPPAGAERASAPLSLGTAVEQAVQSASYHAARARTEAAAGALDQAGRLPNPLLEVREENWQPNDQSGDAHVDIDVFATLTQPVELPGKRAARSAAAAASLDAAQAERSQTARQLVVETARAYLGAVGARELRHSLGAQREALQTLVTAMQRRVREGHTAEADLMKLRTETARLDLQLVEASRELRRQTAALAVLAQEPGPVDAARLQEPPPLDPPSIDTAAGDGVDVQQLAEIRAARARREQAYQELLLERARRFPDPNVTAGYKRTAGVNTIVTGVSVPIPVFDRNSGNVTRAAAEERAAALDLDVLSRRAAAEAAVQIAAARDLAVRARTVDAEFLEPARVVRDAARSAFREGAADVLRLVDAERVYAEAQRETLDLKHEAYAQALEAHLLVNEEFRP